MQQWTLVRTPDELKQFRMDFQALSIDEKEVIWDEMIEHLDQYQDSVHIIAAPKESISLTGRKRGTRRPRRST